MDILKLILNMICIIVVLIWHRKLTGYQQVFMTIMDSTEFTKTDLCSREIGLFLLSSVVM